MHKENMTTTEYIINEEIYKRVILDAIPKAEEFLWLATSDLKDLYITQGKRMIPFLEMLSKLIDKGVKIRMIHAKEPGPAFRKDFDKYPNLIDGMERIRCPRCHLKTVVIDGKLAYSGSANLTGAGIGAKGPNKRNFESGIITSNPEIIEKIIDQFDSIWMGSFCEPCKRKEHCSDFKDIIGN